MPGFYSTPGTNVNTPFFLVPTPEFGHGAGARVQGLDLISAQLSSIVYLLFLPGILIQVSGEKKPFAKNAIFSCVQELRIYLIVNMN